MKKKKKKKKSRHSSTPTCVPGAARAHVLVQRLEITRGTVEAGRGVAGVLDRDLAQAGGESHGARTLEGRGAAPDALAHPARAAVLATRSSVARVQMLAVLPHVFRRAAATENCVTINTRLVLALVFNSRLKRKLTPLYIYVCVCCVEIRPQFR